MCPRLGSRTGTPPARSSSRSKDGSLTGSVEVDGLEDRYRFVPSKDVGKGPGRVPRVSWGVVGRVEVTETLTDDPRTRIFFFFYVQRRSPGVDEGLGSLRVGLPPSPTGPEHPASQTGAEVRGLHLRHLSSAGEAPSVNSHESPRQRLPTSFVEGNCNAGTLYCYFTIGIPAFKRRAARRTPNSSEFARLSTFYKCLSQQTSVF